MNVLDLLNEAREEVNEVEIGISFTLRDLFKGHLWKRIPKGDRLRLGLMFLDYANENEDLNIVGTTTQNTYMKIR